MLRATGHPGRTWYAVTWDMAMGLTGDARLEFLRNSGPAPENA